MSQFDFKLLKRVCEGIPNPVVLIDKEFNCLFSTDTELIPGSDSVFSIFSDKVSFPLNKEAYRKAKIKNKIYCVRIIPVDEYNLCEFLDAKAVIPIVEHSDAFSEIVPVLVQFQSVLGELLLSFDKMCSFNEESGVPNSDHILGEINKNLAVCSSAMMNMMQYVSMVFNNSYAPQPLDLVSLLENMVNYCNLTLSKISRGVDYVHEYDSFFINSPAQYAVCAFTNIIHNALIYSPVDSHPDIKLMKYSEGLKEYALVQVVNLTSLDKEVVSKAFDRFKFGIPIINRFVEIVGGRVKFENENNTFTVKMLLPLVESAGQHGVSVLKGSDDTWQKYDVPLILQAKMKDVILRCQ